MSSANGLNALPSSALSRSVLAAVDALAPKKYARMSLSIPTTSKPSATK
jgi:hypothetical protein